MQTHRETSFVLAACACAAVLAAESCSGARSSGVEAESRSPAPASGASESANAAADRAGYREATYSNRAKPGPTVAVIDGDIKSNNATFTQKVTPNNIADYAELELSKSNFKVLERSSLGPLKREFQIAYLAGDPDAARKLLGKGKFKATRWVLRFDVLKAEPVAKATRGWSGSGLGWLVGGTPGRALDTVQTSEAAGVWIVGMRYTVIDARTTEQAATGYFEQKMEIGSQDQSVLGFHRSSEGGLTLDSLVQRLVQDSVADLDAKYK